MRSRLATMPWQAWHLHVCADSVLGGQVLAHEEWLAPIPAAISFHQAAALPTVGLTAWQVHHHQPCMQHSGYLCTR